MPSAGSTICGTWSTSKRRSHDTTHPTRWWRAGCDGSRTSGSEGGGEETTGRNGRNGASPPTLLCPTSYGFRPGRRAQDAIEEARRFINPPGCYEWLIEGDVENCFGALHHGLLMEQVRRRVTDNRAPALIRQFLAAGVMSELGTVTATPSGAPQGAILSPVLANVALSVLDRHFEATWRAHGAAPRRVRLRAKGQATYRLIRYADDFLVMVAGTRAQAEAIKKQTTEFMAEQMRLTLSPEKTAITHVDDRFDFLGWHVKRVPS